MEVSIGKLVSYSYEVPSTPDSISTKSNTATRRPDLTYTMAVGLVAPFRRTRGINNSTMSAGYGLRSSRQYVNGACGNKKKRCHTSGLGSPRNMLIAFGYNACCFSRQIDRHDHLSPPSVRRIIATKDCRTFFVLMRGFRGKGASAAD